MPQFVGFIVPTGKGPLQCTRWHMQKPRVFGRALGGNPIFGLYGNNGKENGNYYSI